ncbi:MAG: universal stress protein [Alphaproteobacteria bacterium]|nr:universal stress protein [Alphaproteobacteria bacterium]
MGFKVILTPLYGVPSDESALAAAVAVARKFAAHVDVMHVRADPRTMIPYIGEGMSGALIEEMITSAEQQADERSRRVRAAFDDWRAKTGLPLAEAAGEGPSCNWVETVGRPDASVARRGRVADLVVVSRPEAEAAVTTVAETLEAALLESGTPLLVAAARPADKIGSHVAIAWNGGLESARAVAAALPFLAGAEAITIITVGSPAPPEADAPALEAYLARHGVKVQTRNVEVEGGKSVGQTLLATATKAGADMMVMGAYTHSRLRELVFGGVTREVLAAADMPVIMAH